MAAAAETTILLDVEVAAATAVEPKNCEAALQHFVDHDRCFKNVGPDASKACSDTCQSSPGKMIAVCPAGSTITDTDQNGTFTTLTTEVQNAVLQLKSQTGSCPCMTSNDGMPPVALILCKICGTPLPGLRCQAYHWCIFCGRHGMR